MWRWALLLAALAACGCSGGSAKETSGEPAGGAGEKTAKPAAGKKVVMIVSHRDFRDEELFKPRQILEKEGVEVTVASSDLTLAKGMLGGEEKPDMLMRDIDTAEYDAVLFVGGAGATEYWDDRKAHEIARQAQDGGKLVGAICIAPVTLANAGLLDGKKATVWKSEAGRLRAQGATYTGHDVEVDGRIITANGPQSAEKFGRAVLAALEARPRAESP
jgi:protease I